MNGILALDFDGVICDSIDECLVNSYNSFNLTEESKIEKVYSLSTIAPKQVELFRTFRPLVRVAKEYYLLWYLIRMNRTIDPDKDIKKQANIPLSQLERFNSVFYAQRKEWMAKDINSWLDHNPLYKGPKETLAKILHKENVIIVSSKDSSSIRAILEYNGLSIADDRILSSDWAIDKDDHFHRLNEAYSINFTNITFLDDNLENLLKAKDLGISVSFASWGYSMKSEKIRAHEIGIPRVTLKGFGRWVNKVLQ